MARRGEMVCGAAWCGARWIVVRRGALWCEGVWCGVASRDVVWRGAMCAVALCVLWCVVLRRAVDS